VTTDQVLPAAIVAVIAIFAIVGVVRIIRRRRHDAEAFGAGGTKTVPAGTDGIARTAIARTGVVYAAGEEWTARSSNGSTIESGRSVRIVGQDGLILIVVASPVESPAE
jgi:membrane-bound serine protease (ClpP class)